MGKHVILSKLIHDLKNDFVIIRSAANSIRNQKSDIQSELIERKVETIDRALDRSINRLEEIYTSWVESEDSTLQGVLHA